MRSLVSLVCFVLLLAIACSSDGGNDPVPTPPEEALIKESHNDLAYSTTTERQKLDIVLPAKGTTPYPVVLLIHGGGVVLW